MTPAGPSGGVGGEHGAQAVHSRFSVRSNDLAPARLPLPTPGRGFDVPATNRHVLHTHLGRVPASVSEGRFGWPSTGAVCWVAQLHTDAPGLDEVGDAFGMTEREALDTLAREVRRYGAVGPVAASAVAA